NPTGLLPVDVPTADGSQTQFPIGFGLHYPITPADPEFLDRHGRDRDRYTVPESQGVQYLLDGEGTEAGTYQVPPPDRTGRDEETRIVPLVCEPLDLRELTGGASTEWTMEFTPERAVPGHGVAAE